jgi:hypothetical protein
MKHLGSKFGHDWQLENSESYRAGKQWRCTRCGTVLGWIKEDGDDYRNLEAGFKLTFSHTRNQCQRIVMDEALK